MPQKKTAAIHVRLDTAREFADDAYYLVSRIDEDGEVIRYYTGFEDFADAWSFATGVAENLQVPAINCNAPTERSRS